MINAAGTGRQRGNLPDARGGTLAEAIMPARLACERAPERRAITPRRLNYDSEAGSLCKSDDAGLPFVYARVRGRTLYSSEVREERLRSAIAVVRWPMDGFG